MVRSFTIITLLDNFSEEWYASENWENRPMFNIVVAKKLSGVGPT